MDAAGTIQLLQDRFSAVENAERAVQGKRYLKSDLDFSGATNGEVKKAVTAALAVNKDLDRDGLCALLKALWSTPSHELHMSAVYLAQRRETLFAPDDIALLEHMLRHSHTWAYVDHLAIHPAGRLLLRHDAAGAVLDAWSDDEDFWIRRSSMLALLTPLSHDDLHQWPRFVRYADKMLDEKEFFIRKAIGWVLRAVSKKNPDVVADFVRPRTGRISGVSIREAVKYLPAAERDALMSAYRGR